MIQGTNDWALWINRGPKSYASFRGWLDQKEEIRTRS